MCVSFTGCTLWLDGCGVRTSVAVAFFASEINGLTFEPGAAQRRGGYSFGVGTLALSILSRTQGAPPS